MSSGKKPLGPEHLEECRALRDAIQEYNAARPRAQQISQKKAGDLMGISQGAFSSFMNGRLIINKNFALNVLKIFSIPVEAYSLRLAAEFKEISSFDESQGVKKFPPSVLHCWERLSIALIRLPAVPVSGVAKAMEEIESERQRFNGMLQAMMMSD